MSVAAILKPAMLPGILAPIAETVSIEAALRVAREFGGRRLSFPDAGALDPHHVLIQAIGAESAERIRARLAGGSFIVPHARTYLRLVDVARLRAAGLDDRTIARQLRITAAEVGAVPRGTGSLAAAASSSSECLG